MAQMKYFYELTISSSPHVHSKTTTQIIMRDVLIALAPALFILGSWAAFKFVWNITPEVRAAMAAKKAQQKEVQ